MSQDLIPQGFQVKDNIVLACNGVGLKNLLQAGRQWLEAHVNIVNGLNVFPVPDGDTGTNMVLTMRSALAEVEKAANHEAGVIAAAAAHGALMGARGNSGVILSQFLQGLAVRLANLATFTAEDFAQAAQIGAEKAYQSVVDPVEGTILTVARQVAIAAQHCVKSNQDLVVLLSDIVEAAQIAQAHTPQLLPILKEAGVTDSGGQGLVYILEGGLRFLKQQPVEVDPVGETVPFLQSTLGADEKAYGYDVQFLIQGQNLNVAQIRAQIDRLGWSTVVVGDEHTVKVHVHAADPGIPISYGASQGIIGDVVIENMEQQAKQFVHEHLRPWSAAPEKTSRPMTEVVSVVLGPGLARIFQSLGASRVLSGGQTMNPSPREIVEVINQVEADNVLVLPNNTNVILAAQQAQALSRKNVKVIPAQTIPQGIAALLSFNQQADLDTNSDRMRSAAQQVQTLEVTRAVRDAGFNGFSIQAGDVMALLDGKLAGVGQNYEEVILELLSQIKGDEYEIITIYFGQESSAEQAEALAHKINRLYPGIELEIHEGGQPHYHYIISLE